MDHTEYLRLVEEVNRLRTATHLFNTEEIPESALDDLKHKITQYEESNPNEISKNSPNYTIAGGILSGFSKFIHERRVLSLNDLFSFEELIDWQNRWQDYLFSLKDTPAIKALNINFSELTGSLTEQKKQFRKLLNLPYIAEPKLDGMALILHYEGGILANAVTRGDSRIGENVTDNIRLIPAIPYSIPSPHRIEVRGELIMARSDFEALNESITKGEKKGKMGKTGKDAVFANPRNAVAGTIRNLDQSIIRERPMSFIAYGLFETGLETSQEAF